MLCKFVGSKLLHSLTCGANKGISNIKTRDFSIVCIANDLFHLPIIFNEIKYLKTLFLNFILLFLNDFKITSSNIRFEDPGNIDYVI